MNFQQARALIEKRKAGVIMRDDAFQRRDDTAEKRSDVTGAHEKVVNLQQDLQAIAFARQLLLISLSRFEIDGIIDGHSNRCRNSVHEFDLRFGHALRRISTETDGAQTVLRCSQGDNGDGVYAFTLQRLHEIWVARIVGGVESDE